MKKRDLNIINEICSFSDDPFTRVNYHFIFEGKNLYPKKKTKKRK